MADKYPEFYIRKRQREETYRRTVQIVVGVAILIIIGGVGGFFLYKYVLQPVRQPVPEAKELADERQQLATQNALSQVPSQQPEKTQPAGGGKEGQQIVADLGNIPYDPSFPGVHVGVEGSNTSVALEGAEAEQDEADSNSGAVDQQDQSAPTPPSGREQSDSLDRASQQAAANSTTNTGNSGTGTQQKNDQDSEDASKTKPPANAEDKEPESKPAVEEPGTGEMVFHVYAGTYATRDAAETAKKDLQALGFQGNIITVGSEFHVRVASLDDFERASAIRQKLIDSGFTKAFATRERQ
jgi:hypothetical protein